MYTRRRDVGALTLDVRGRAGGVVGQVFYVMVRSLGAGTSKWLFSFLPKLLSRRLPNAESICGAVLLGVVVLDEAVHACATASVDGTHKLLGSPCAKSPEPIVCCICHEDDDEDGEALYDYCPVRRLGAPPCRFVCPRPILAVRVLGWTPGSAPPCS